MLEVGEEAHRNSEQIARQIIENIQRESICIRSTMQIHQANLSHENRCK